MLHQEPFPLLWQHKYRNVFGSIIQAKVQPFMSINYTALPKLSNNLDIGNLVQIKRNLPVLITISFH